MDRLQGKVAVITGGAGGIGKAAGAMFAVEGADVLLVDMNAEALQVACDEIGSNRVSWFVADVTDAADNQAMIDCACERYGGVDIFLANAGIEGPISGLLDVDEDNFDQVMSVNVKGPFLGLRAAVPAMRERGGGSVVITSSVAGVGGSPMLAPYVTSKHAVIGLMRSAAKEFAADRIRVNTVNPSPVDTRMMRSIEDGIAPGGGEAIKENFEQSIPMGRYGQPDDIAKVMLFLASDDAEFLTGSVYMADGGYTA